LQSNVEPPLGQFSFQELRNRQLVARYRRYVDQCTNEREQRCHGAPRSGGVVEYGRGGPVHVPCRLMKLGRVAKGRAHESFPDSRVLTMWNALGE